MLDVTDGLHSHAAVSETLPVLSISYKRRYRLDDDMAVPVYECITLEF